MNEDDEAAAAAQLDLERRHQDEAWERHCQSHAELSQLISEFEQDMRRIKCQK